MAEPTPATPPAETGFPDAAKHNAEVAAALLKQSPDVMPGETKSAGDALDALAKQAEEKKGTPPVVEAKAAPANPPANQPTPEQKAAAEAKAKTDAENAANLEAANKLFKDAPGLPQGASPKSSEAFNSIKIKAAQEISQREAELEKARKELAELKEKSKSPLTPEIEKELTDLRTWRAKLDVDADPKFKQFDQRITAAQDFIYAQLKKSPVVTDAVIDEIKKLGGPEKVKLDKLFAAISDPTLQNIVQAKIADITVAEYEKEGAIKQTKENIQQYMEDRNKQMQAAASSHTVATKQRVDSMIPALDWFKEKQADDKADEATKKDIAEHNKFVSETREQLQVALQDDSADMRAILLTGMVQLFNQQRVNAKLTAERDALKAKVDEVTAKWEAVKNSSTSRLRESGAPTGGIPAVKPTNSINTHAGDALDALAKQVMETRAAAGK